MNRARIHAEPVPPVRTSRSRGRSMRIRMRCRATARREDRAMPLANELGANGRLRLALAQRVADAHRGIDDASLLSFVSGSTVDNLADARSDVDMSVVFAALPDEPRLREAGCGRCPQAALQATLPARNPQRRSQPFHHPPHSGSLTPPAYTPSSPWCRTRAHNFPARAGRSCCLCGHRRARGSRLRRSANSPSPCRPAHAACSAWRA